MYYSYHARAKQLIKSGQLISYKIVDKWHDITPALVLFFSSHRPMPIRQEKWAEYFKLLADIE